MRLPAWRAAAWAMIALSIGATIAAAQDSTDVEADSLAPPPVTNAATSANVFNPAISAIGWFQAQSGRLDDPADAFRLKEVELGIQSVVDPYGRADFFIAAGEGGELEVEEGYLTLLALPAGVSAKLGRFRADFGKFNRTHPPETPFADRPRAGLHFLGEEGLAFTGISSTITVPNPFGVYWDLTAQAGRVPDEVPLFAPRAGGDLAYVARTSAFVELGEAMNLNLGLSGASAPPAEGVLPGATGQRAQLAGADLTFRWKNPRRSIYRSLLVQVEGLAAAGSDVPGVTPRGLSGWSLYQFTRRMSLGARLDYTELPGTARDIERGALALLQYRPSEFSTVSLQARRVRGPDGVDRDSAFLKWIFSVGPHGAHPF